jgi:hypothetical protein
MSFFNKKEDVYDIELTSYGKRKLSEGLLKPVYYAFFDDDIIYDPFGAGVTETQNEAQVRILEMPRLRTQANFMGVETDIKRQLDPQRTNLKQEDSEHKVNTTKFIAMSNPAEKAYASCDSLGTSDQRKDVLPSWQIMTLKNQIVSANVAITGGYGTVSANRYPNKTYQIPQININLEYEVKRVKELGSYQRGSLDDHSVLKTYADGSALLLKKDDVVLEIIELNGIFSNKNFDIEVLEITASAQNLFSADGTINSDWRKQHPADYYPGSQFYFVADELPPSEQIVDPTFVEHYFDIKVDNEIDDALMCKLKPADTSKGLFDKRGLTCPPPTPGDTNENVYGIPMGTADQEGPCDD